MTPTQPFSTPQNITKTKLNINHALDTVMRQQGLTQSQLAAKIGRDRAYINRILRGKDEAPLSMKLKIAKVLETDSRIIFPVQSEVRSDV